MKKCVSCNKEIHPKRLEILPGATKCVECSTTGKKAGVTIVVGEGDHTYNDVIIMDREDFDKLQELEYKIHGHRKDDLPHPEEEMDEVIDEEEVIDIEELDLNEEEE